MTVSTGVAIRQIAVNGSGGAWVEVDATIVSRYAEAIEDFAANGGAPQGLQYEVPLVGDDGQISWPGPVFSIAPESEPLQFGDKKALHMPSGPILAAPGQPVIGFGTGNAMPICRLRSASVTATVVNFTEFQ
jgi:hypothetical protein